MPHDSSHLGTNGLSVLFFFVALQDLPKPIRANFILNVETDELFITAGLQDRVVQVGNRVSAAQMHRAQHVTIFHLMPVAAWIVGPSVFAGLWRLSLHGFQQEAHGRSGLRYWSRRLPVDAKKMIQIHVFSNVCVFVYHSQGTMFLWTWLGSHRSGWLTWATPVTLDASTATSDSAGSAVCPHIICISLAPWGSRCQIYNCWNVFTNELFAVWPMCFGFDIWKRRWWF